MRSSLKAQMSLIMMLIIAIALVFYAVAQNWNKIAIYKTQVTIASNTGASTLASMMASYGEYWVQTQLGGNTYLKEATGTLVEWIVAIVVLVIAVVVTIISWGTAGPGAFALVMLVFTVVVLPAATIVVHTTYIQPMLTKAWSKQMQNINSLDGQFREQAIQGMMTGVLGDMAEVDDRWDLDMDGKWYIPGAGGTPGLGDPQAGKVPRFAYYYANRLNSLQGMRSPMSALKMLLTQMQRELGLSKTQALPEGACHVDPSNLASALIPQCDPCCQAIAKRPSTCPGYPDWQVPYLPQCAIGNPGCTSSNLNACYVYDPMYRTYGPVEEAAPQNLMYVFGEDDVDPHYKKVLGSYVPEGPPSPFDNPVIHAISPTEPTRDGGAFRGSDATGKFFPFLWLMADTQVGVKGLQYINPDTTLAQCIWRAGLPACQDEVGVSTPSVGNTIGNVFYRPSTAYWQMNLNCNGDDCLVNKFKKSLPGVLPLKYDGRQIDNVQPIDAFLPTASNACPAFPYETDPVAWKKGSDRFSQTFTEPWWDDDKLKYAIYSLKYLDTAQPPQSAGCIDNEGCFCTTENLIKERWRVDSMDETTKLLSDFARTAVALAQSSDIVQSQFKNFIEVWGNPLQEQAASLEKMRDKLLNPGNAASLTGEINRWLAGTGYDNAQSELWCLPPDPTWIPSQQERDAILTGTDPSTGSPPVWGSLLSVIRCEQWNSNNQAKFAACAEAGGCPDNCLELPRSLVPGFDPNVGMDCDPENDYMQNIALSKILAVNQSLKFAKRASYLSDLFYRAYTIRNTFVYAYNYLATPLGAQDLTDSADILNAVDDFLPGAANLRPTQVISQLVAWIKQHADWSSPDLQDKVIYGWFSKDNKVPGTDRGYFHAIKVQARINNPMMWVDTDTNWLATQRWYELKDGSGSVVTRVVRYDEDHDFRLKFLSGLPLWNIRYGSRRGPGMNTDPGSIMQDLYAYCTKHFKQISGGGGSGFAYDLIADNDPVLKEAFMLNLPLNAAPSEGIHCLDLVEQLLKRGIAAETCAQYNPVCTGEDKSGDGVKDQECHYDVKFKPCN